MGAILAFVGIHHFYDTGLAQCIKQLLDNIFFVALCQFAEL